MDSFPPPPPHTHTHKHAGRQARTTAPTYSLLMHRMATLTMLSQMFP